MAADLRRYAATNARVRALLGTLLGRSSLDMLCGYPSTEAVCEALVRTPYHAVTDGPATPERRLLTRLADVGRLVLGLLDDPERAFVRQYLLHHELANLKVLIRGIAGQLSSQALSTYLVAWPGIATIDSQALAIAHDLRDLVERLRGSSYGRAAQAALHHVDTAGPFALEVGLDLDYYERLWAATATLRHADSQRAQHLLGILFDVLNLGWISRYHALGLSPEEILNYTLRQGRWVTIDVRRRVAESRDTPWAAALVHTPYAALLADVPPRRFDAAAAALWRFLAGEIQRTLTGYPFHIGVPLGFLLAQEIEIRDLRVLLAAKSIGVPGAEIVEHLATVRH